MCQRNAGTCHQNLKVNLTKINLIKKIFNLIFLFKKIMEISTTLASIDFCEEEWIA